MFLFFFLRRWSNTIRFSCFRLTVKQDWPNGISTSGFNMYLFFKAYVNNFSLQVPLKKFWISNYPPFNSDTKLSRTLFQMTTEMSQMIAEKLSHRKICFPIVHKKYLFLSTSLNGSNTSLNDGTETQEVSTAAPATFRNDSKYPQKTKTCEPESSKSRKTKHRDIKNHAFLTSIVIPATLKPSLKPDLRRDDLLTSQLFTQKLQFEFQLTSLYMVSTP